ncbi:MAG TPA: SLBB domain-containing protein [Rhizomicrobium sp.]
MSKGLWSFSKGRRLAFAVLAFGALVAAGGLAGTVALAQDVTPDALRALQQRVGGDNPDLRPRPNEPEVQTYQPIVPSDAGSPPSHLEKLYKDRSGKTLTQFGYDFLGVSAAVSIAQNGAIGENFILGPGDELVITLRGQENTNYRVNIDRDGLVTLPKLKPLIAAGIRFGEFRRRLQAEVGQAFVSTEAFVSLGEVHQFSVIVAGEVRTPGARIVNSLSTALDAILLSGGISKTGSLRNVQLLRDGRRITIDFYSVIAQGNASFLGTLRDGDRLYVPPLGATVAVAGFVRRQGIYELSPGARGASAQSLIRLAGGIEIAGAYNLSKSHLEIDGTTRLIIVQPGTLIASGEILFVDANKSAILDQVALKGSVAVEGTRPLSSAPDTSALLRDASDLTADSYTPFALIVRRDSVSDAISLVPFSVSASIARRVRTPLQSSDRVYVFRHDEIQALTAVVTKNVNAAFEPNGGGQTRPALASAPGAGGGPDVNSNSQPDDNGDGVPDAAGTAVPPGSGVAAPPPANRHAPSGSAEAAALAQSEDILRKETGRLATTIPPAIPVQSDDEIVGYIAKNLGITTEQLIRIASDHLVWVLDEVYAPGPYLAARGTSLAEMIQAAGGVTQRADLSTIEVTSTDTNQALGISQTLRSSYSFRDGAVANVVVRSQDVIRLRPVFTDRDEGTVTIAGQVRYPGVFDITRDERLSSILQRAGGLTEVAYPYGAVFTRQSAAVNERQGNERAAREIEGQIATLASRPGADPNTTGNVTYLNVIVQQLRQLPALGRIMINADPTVLAIKPEVDPILQPGDALYIPKRPSSVSVSGEVLNPGSFQYLSTLSLDDYIRLAGGPTQTAEVGSTFIILPDGSAAPRDEGLLSFGGTNRIPPGSTIVVPRDLNPFNLSQFLKDFTLIASQLAVTAASLSVLGRTN